MKTKIIKILDRYLNNFWSTVPDAKIELIADKILMIFDAQDESRSVSKNEDKEKFCPACGDDFTHDSYNGYCCQSCRDGEYGQN